MGISKGDANECVTCACSAIIKLWDQVVTWPSEEERQNISAQIWKMYGFVNCVGLWYFDLFSLCTHTECWRLFHKERWLCN